MRRVKSANTSPEIRVRRLVHAMGYRYSLHSQKLPGKPDIVLASRHKVILVHGCFWHMHSCRRGQALPAANRAYWAQKRQRNAARDKRNLRSLHALGWKALVIWECRTLNEESLRGKLERFLRD
jgi:DNA mismatch endonuclease, patch repair protein